MNRLPTVDRTSTAMRGTPASAAKLEGAFATLPPEDVSLAFQQSIYMRYEEFVAMLARD